MRLPTLRPVDWLIVVFESFFALYWLVVWGEADLVPLMVSLHVVAAGIPFVIARMARG
jgi:hypothetical protein